METNSNSKQFLKGPTMVRCQPSKNICVGHETRCPHGTMEPLHPQQPMTCDVSICTDIYITIYIYIYHMYINILCIHNVYICIYIYLYANIMHFAATFFLVSPTHFGWFLVVNPPATGASRSHVLVNHGSCLRIAGVQLPMKPRLHGVEWLNHSW